MQKALSLAVLISVVLLLSISEFGLMEMTRANWIPTPFIDAPRIVIESPTKTNFYNTSKITLYFNVIYCSVSYGYNVEIKELNFCLDEQTFDCSNAIKVNTTYSQGMTTTKYKVTLLSLVDGYHSLSVSTTIGTVKEVLYMTPQRNGGVSDVVYFSVDTLIPAIIGISPENKTYTYNQIPLMFSVNETELYTAYSLDNQSAVTIFNNSTLPQLADSSHNIVLFIKDKAGNVGSSRTSFAIDTTFPTFSGISVEGKTFNSSEVPICLNVNEAISHISCSLDNQANATIDGNYTLKDLSEGQHNIVFYANDTAGNMGKSDTFFFTVKYLPSPSPIHSPTLAEVPYSHLENDYVSIALIVTSIVAVVGVLAYAVNRKKS